MLSSRRFAAALALACACLLIGSVTGAFAAHQFDDVPDNNVFHDDIDHIAAAGITTGFLDGTYRPGEPVTRGSMAAFLGRSATRVGYDEGSVTTTSNADQTLATIEMERGGAGSVGSAQGYYVVFGTVQIATTSDTSCPCTTRAYVNGSSVTYSVMSPDDDSSGRARDNLTMMAVVPAEHDDTASIIQLRASADGDTGTPSFDFDGQLAVFYVPFGHDGTQTLS